MLEAFLTFSVVVPYLPVGPFPFTKPAPVCYV